MALLVIRDVEGARILSRWIYGTFPTVSGSLGLGCTYIGIQRKAKTRQGHTNVPGSDLATY